MFTTDPGLVPVLNHEGETVQDLWYLDEDLIWRGLVMTITVPAGFITDDASIPKVLDWITPLDRQGASRRPGLMHDALYSLGRKMGKAWCDQFLREACLAEGMSEWGAWVIYQGVHLFGGRAWAADKGQEYKITTEGSFMTKYYYDQFVLRGSTLFS